MDIRDINDLSKAVNKAKNIELSNGQSAVTGFKLEVEKLKAMIQAGIDEYYDDPINNPTWYTRTNDWRTALDIMETKVTGQAISITIGFHPELAYHPSYLDEDKYEQGYVPWLMEVGWDIRDKIHADNRFTHFKGIHYIKNAVKAFRKNNRYGLTVRVYFENHYGAKVRYI